MSSYRFDGNQDGNENSNHADKEKTIKSGMEYKKNMFANCSHMSLREKDIEYLENCPGYRNSQDSRETTLPKESVDRYTVLVSILTIVEVNHYATDGISEDASIETSFKSPIYPLNKDSSALIGEMSISLKLIPERPFKLQSRTPNIKR